MFVSADNASNAVNQILLAGRQEGLLADMYRDVFSASDSDWAEAEVVANEALQSKSEDDDDRDTSNDGAPDGNEDHLTHFIDSMLENGNLGHLTIWERAPKFRVTFNFQLCVAHTLQLSVRQALSRSTIRSTINSVRQTCKLFKKSSSGAAYLRNAQIAKGKIPLRLHLDVKTRWGSTLQIASSVLKNQCIRRRCNPRPCTKINSTSNL